MHKHKMYIVIVLHWYLSCFVPADSMLWFFKHIYLCTVYRNYFKFIPFYIFIHIRFVIIIVVASLCGSVRCTFDWCSGGHGSDLHWAWQHSFMEIDHQIFSRVILSNDSRRAFVSFWWKNVLIYWLTAWRTKPAKEKVWLGKLTMLNMTPRGLLGCKISTQTKLI